MHVGLRIPGDQRQITPALPLHLVDVITVGDRVQIFADASGLRIPGDQRQITPALPLHLVDVITVGDRVQIFADASGNNQSLVEV
nr:hypothetical protein CFP56_56112 [Quercus suber]